MNNERRVAHPKDLPYMVVQEDDEGNPPHMALFGSKQAAIAHARTRAFHDCKKYQVFKVEQIVMVVPQDPLVTELK